jgi:magnesium chelatase subunit D
MTAQGDPASLEQQAVLRYADAMAVATLFAVDPSATGVVLRSRPDAMREHWLRVLATLLPADAPQRRVPPQIADDRLLGGLDLSATLAAGRPIRETGVLGAVDGGVIMLAMAERMASETAARIAMIHDAGVMADQPARFGIVAIDEGVDDDERTPSVLSDRLAFAIELAGIRYDPDWALPSAVECAAVEAARRLLPRVTVPDQWLEALCAASMMLGVRSARSELLAVRVARCAAALDGQTEVSAEHVDIAARLVLAHRATRIPEMAQPPEQPEQQPDNTPPPQNDAESPLDQPPPDTNAADNSTAPSPDSLSMPDDLMIAEAVASLLPGLLAQIAAQGRSSARSTGPTARRSGRSRSKAAAAVRGRATRVRAGDPGKGARLDILATLCAAAPWQMLRQRDVERAAVTEPTIRADPHIAVRRSDFRVKRILQPVLTTTIFVVDASGSSALNRLAEAKGAVSLLLADCYVRRDQVALIAFRGKSAEVLLPPTRALARAKRSLSGLPGGGGTPVALGIDAALALALEVRRRGRVAQVVLMTDARANITREGKSGRAAAQADATAAAQRLRAAGIRAILIDTSTRPEPLAARLAEDLAALYLPLPYADASTITRVVKGSGAGGAARAGVRV